MNQNQTKTFFRGKPMDYRCSDIEEACRSPELASDFHSWSKASLMFSLWIHRSFEDRQAIALVSVGGEVFARRTVFKNDTGKPPQAHFAEAAFDSATAHMLKCQLKAIQLQPFRAYQVGFDGVSKGVIAPTYSGNVELSWWEGVPDSWKELEKWYGSAWRIIEPALPEVPQAFNIGYRTSRVEKAYDNGTVRPEQVPNSTQGADQDHAPPGNRDC